MKPQDIAFIIVVMVLIALRRPNYFIYAGLSCLALAIPLFTLWVFFTAQHLVWYAGFFFLLFILFSLRRQHKVQ
ncbi:MAG: hypothetical protein UY16_C0005G0021 [Candidatus Gottesmanbacteria bacterium GW2011_GWA2_47_9]|uniref:Uncharacterized protein n=2 Tax=Microgenomates group TaxID=1794810 RepID=A0A0G1WE25_9BACT|nr:MAG: hypothetical protein UV66_C0008G0004 [Candidatus Woesebacteria bacterium GW2011_GWA1_43_12]KKU88578.1 MAG: hypothetical protein UY16_C0005G0021 [Candidatus Gottesmanbacteria bacterium GW2011_GWA2_47_9]